MQTPGFNMNCLIFGMSTKRSKRKSEGCHSPVSLRLVKLAGFASILSASSLVVELCRSSSKTRTSTKALISQSLWLQCHQLKKLLLQPHLFTSALAGLLEGLFVQPARTSLSLVKKWISLTALIKESLQTWLNLGDDKQYSHKQLRGQLSQDYNPWQSNWKWTVATPLVQIERKVVKPPTSPLYIVLVWMLYIFQQGLK